MPPRSVLPSIDLFVGEHGAELGAPVDRDLGLVGEPALEQLQEDPLRPAEVVGIGGVDLARPVVAEAEHLELAAEGGDVLAAWSLAGACRS